MMFDVAVIGRGMIGAAAARHLAEAGHEVALIGPNEPSDRQTSGGPFSSHPDAGRITRIAGRDEIWTELAARAIARYDDIARRSGIEFHVPRGLAVGFTDAADWVRRAVDRGSDAQLISPGWLRDTTGISISRDVPVLFEGPPAGWINPRRMVVAQTTLVAAAGGLVIADAATRIRSGARGLEISGSFGLLRARRALLATGAFGSGLLDARLDVDRRPRTVLMTEMADDERIPSLILQGPPDDRLREIYWVPPTRYPDGVMRLKIGGNLEEHPFLEPEDLVDWFHSEGSATELEALENSLRSLLPDAEFGTMTSSPCVVTGTPTGHPYIGWIDDHVAVAIGGNGSAAKSGDELGRLAATLFSDQGWADSLDEADFAPRLA